MKKASFDIILGKKFKYKKRVKTTYVRLSVAAQQAKPTPPLGPTIGQYGLNIAESAKNLIRLLQITRQAQLYP
jgi:ribosomal protein L11